MTKYTVLYFVAHASVLLRYNDKLVLTDPWFDSPAFSSWLPCPPPTLNPDILIGMAQSGNMSILLSHAHPDHVDLSFLKRLPNDIEIFIPQYKDGHFPHLLEGIGCKNITEIPDEGCSYHEFKFHRFLHHISKFDSAISIETPDAFIMHGNDAWTLSEKNSNDLLAIKPNTKPSLFMGQGGSASGHPLTYFEFDMQERIDMLYQKKL